MEKEMVVDNVPLVNVYRGGELESSHAGSYVVVKDGKVIMSGGAADQKVYFRSSAKPIQALPTIITGTAEAFGIGQKELSATCGSHLGEEMHTEMVQDLLDRGGLVEDDLQCGPAWPSHKQAKVDVIRGGFAKRRIYHNCSGKHTGMLLNCRHNGWPIETYLEPSHPLQQIIWDYIAYFSGVDRESIHVAIDGCGAPVFYLGLKDMANAYARYANPDDSMDPTLRVACWTIARAMQTHPRQYSGSTAFCGDLCAAGKGLWINKGGAEGIYCVGVHDAGVGIAVKCNDGYERGIIAVVLDIMDRLGILTAEHKQELDARINADVINSQDKIVGKIRSAIGKCC